MKHLKRVMSLTIVFVLTLISAFCVHSFAETDANLEGALINSQFPVYYMNPDESLVTDKYQNAATFFDLLNSKENNSENHEIWSAQYSENGNGLDDVTTPEDFYDMFERLPKNNDGRIYIYVPLFGNEITINHEIDLPDNVTVKFSNGTIKCNKCRAFDLYGDNVNLILEDITITNGQASEQYDYAWGDLDYGGAIYVDGSKCSIKGYGNTIIKNCSADYCGGGIAICGHYCSVDNIQFDNCTAEYGGAIYVYYSFSKIANCVFSRSIATDKQGNYVYADHKKTATGIISCSKTDLSAKNYISHSLNSVDESNGNLGGNYKIYSKVESFNNTYGDYFTASAISEGNYWIVIIGAVIIVVGVLFIILKKRV